MISATISDDVPVQAKKMLSMNDSPLNFIKELIGKGQKNGEIIGGDPEKLSTLYWAMIQGLILFRYNQDLAARMPDVDMVLSPFNKGI